MSNRADPRHILITGASSGIGAALAERYARPGRKLALIGRDADRLGAVAQACEAAGAAAQPFLVDVTDRAAMAQTIAAADDHAPLDLVVANAGVSEKRVPLTALHDTADTVMRINVEGVFNTVHPALNRMMARGTGQIALMASLAGYLGLPGAPAYCASKAAVKTYGESLRQTVAETGVVVSVICPGFIETPLTAQNPFPMPQLMAADAAADKIVRGLAKGRARISFPTPLANLVWLLSTLPPAWRDPILKRLG